MNVSTENKQRHLCTVEEARLLNALSDPNNHQKFVEYLETLGLLPSFLRAITTREVTA